MKIDFKEIKEMLQTSSLTEVSRQTGIPLRTLENYKYGTNNSFRKMEETLSTLQKYLNEKGENKMNKEIKYIVSIYDGKGNNHPDNDSPVLDDIDSAYDWIKDNMTVSYQIAQRDGTPLPLKFEIYEQIQDKDGYWQDTSGVNIEAFLSPETSISDKVIEDVYDNLLREDIEFYFRNNEDWGYRQSGHFSDDGDWEDSLEYKTDMSPAFWEDTLHDWELLDEDGNIKSANEADRVGFLGELKTIIEDN